MSARIFGNVGDREACQCCRLGHLRILGHRNAELAKRAEFRFRIRDYAAGVVRHQHRHRASPFAEELLLKSRRCEELPFVPGQRNGYKLS